MQQSPSWEGNRFSAAQEITRFLCKPKVHYRIHNSPPRVSIPSQIDPLHALHPNSQVSISVLSVHLRLGRFRLKSVGNNLIIHVFNYLLFIYLFFFFHIFLLLAFTNLSYIYACI
jgi:hypothetical protein